MADVAMYHVKKELQSPNPALRASPYPFQTAQRTTTTTTTTTHTHTLAPVAAAPVAVMPSLHQSLANPMAFDLDFLDPAAPLAMNSGVGAASAASLHAVTASSASHNPLDDLNLLDSQPPLLTLPGDSEMRVTVTASTQYATTQQFSDASSVSSAGSPDHNALSPTTTHSTASFGSTPTSPNSPNSPISPQQPQSLYPTPAATAAAAAALAARNGAAWSLAAPSSTLPLPLYPLTAAATAPVNSGLPTIYTPAQKRGTSPLSVALPQPASRAGVAAAPATTKATASASAGRSPTTASAAPKPKKPELASAAKGRRGGGRAKATAGGSPSASDEEDLDGLDGGDDKSAGGGSGDDKRSKRERNKLSAMKYRKRRKVYLDGLESKVADLNDTVTSLHTENKLLKEQLDFLKNLLRNGGELPSSPVKFGDSSKPMSHAANQPPALPKIPRPSQLPQHSTLALFCVLACVLLCVTSPDSFFGSFSPATPLSSLSAAPGSGLAPPTEALHSRQSRYLLSTCACARPAPAPASASASASDTSGGGSGEATVAANANPQTNHTECACAEDADAVDVEAPVAPAPAVACEAAPEAPAVAVPAAPAVIVN